MADKNGRSPLRQLAMGDKKYRSPLRQLSLQQGRIPDFIGDGGVLISGMSTEIYSIARLLNITLARKLTPAILIAKQIHRVTLFQNDVRVRLYVLPVDFMALYRELCLRNCLVFVHTTERNTILNRTLVRLGAEKGIMRSICAEDAIITTGRLICKPQCYLNILTFLGSHFIAISFRNFYNRNGYRAVVVMHLELEL